MLANMENSAVATRLEKVHFHPNPKARQCQRMFKLPHNCAHVTCQQGNAQNPLSQASTIGEPRTCRCKSWIEKRQTKQRSTDEHPLYHRDKRIPEKNFCFIDYTKVFDCVDHKKLWKILKEMGIPDYLTCLLRNLYADQKQPLEMNMEQWIGSKSGKEYVKDIYCHPAYLAYMQSTSCKVLG